MNTSTIAIGIGLLVLAGLAYYLYRSITLNGDPTKTIVQNGSVSGLAETNTSVTIPKSFNQPEGAVFTYTGWLTVSDFTINYGTKRLVFTQNDCPGLYIDSTSNSLMLVLNTFGATETVLIPNIPANKWIHFAIVVNQYAVDVYINGLIKQHHTLNQLPKQQDGTVTIGSPSVGFQGYVSDLTYFSRALTTANIAGMQGSVPPNPAPGPSGPPYFSSSWYVGR
jgi:hypothetical protein